MNEKPTIRELFAGMGAFSVAGHWCGFETADYSELDPDAASVFSYWFPGAKPLGDIRTLDGRTLGFADVLTGGVPCQPASLMGARRGSSDERWLWPDAIRIVRETRPSFALFENPPALLTLEGGSAINGIVSELSALGYDLWWETLSVAAVGGGHLRERVFILAADATGIEIREHGDEANSKSGEGKAWAVSGRRSVHEVEASPPSNSDCERLEGERILLRKEQDQNSQTTGCAQEIPSPDSMRSGLEGHTRDEDRRGGGQDERRSIASQDFQGLDLTDPLWFETQSPVYPLVNGIPGGLVEASLRCVGNSACPQVIQIFLKEIRKHL